MKNISTLLFVLLFALVALLFYFQFSGKNTPPKNIDSKDDSTKAKLNVAYVDIDSLETNYEYYKQVQNSFEKKRDSIDKILNSDFNAIENERIQFIQRGNSISEIEAENFALICVRFTPGNAGKKKVSTLKNVKFFYVLLYFCCILCCRGGTDSVLVE